MARQVASRIYIYIYGNRTFDLYTKRILSNHYLNIYLYIYIYLFIQNLLMRGNPMKIRNLSYLHKS